MSLHSLASFLDRFAQDTTQRAKWIENFVLLHVTVEFTLKTDRGQR